MQTRDFTSNARRTRAFTMLLAAPVAFGVIAVSGSATADALTVHRPTTHLAVQTGALKKLPHRHGAGRTATTVAAAVAVTDTSSARNTITSGQAR